jgi:hypothetical protein
MATTEGPLPVRVERRIAGALTGAPMRPRSGGILKRRWPGLPGREAEEVPVKLAEGAGSRRKRPAVPAHEPEPSDQEPRRRAGSSIFDCKPSGLLLLVRH